MPIRIGANPIGWSNDDLQHIGGNTPLETCLAEAREAGFEGMELGHKFPREPFTTGAEMGYACFTTGGLTNFPTKSKKKSSKGCCFIP